MYQHQILKNVLSICTLSIFYACPLIQSLLTSWKEMRHVRYSLFNSVWLYRMTWWDDMVSCAPGQLSGVVWGIYAIVYEQTDSTPQSALGASAFPVLMGGWFLPFQHLPLAVVLLPSLCCPGAVWGEAGGGWTGSLVSVLRHLDNPILESQDGWHFHLHYVWAKRSWM